MTAERLNELKEMAAKLLETARELPPGQDRDKARQEIARFRARINRSATPRFAVGAAKAEGEGEIAADGRSPLQPVDAARGRPLSKNGGCEYPPRSNRGKTESAGSRDQGTRLHDRTPAKMV